MAVFEVAHKESMGNEGGVSFNPDDKGNLVVNGVVTRPTYKGVAPRSHPSWPGWKYVDGIIKSLGSVPRYGTSEYYRYAKDFNKYAAANPALQKAVIDFYAELFWQANRLDEIQNQTVANQMYDWAVNTGSRGNVWIQTALDLAPDGCIGPKSVAAINAADPDQLLRIAREYAKAHRLEVCRKHPDQKQFLVGWLSRDGFSKEEIAGIMA